MTRSRAARVAGCLLALCAIPVQAQGPSTSPEDARRGIVTRSPVVRVDKVDQDRLAVHRIDIVDDKGVIRATLGASLPEPVIDGVQYKRIFPAAGLLLFDRDGSERGGYAVADIDGAAVAAVSDHAGNDAIGWRVMPDGSVTFQINERAPVRRDPVHGNIVPGAAATRIAMSVAADGTPAIALRDKQDRPRLRMTVTPEGYGAIEFLDAEGHVVETFCPEARQAAK